MLCCSAQIHGVWGSPDQTLEIAREAIENAAKAGAALIAFPEQFATGWDPISAAHAEDIGGRTVSRLRKLAKEHSIAIIGSFRERHDPKPTNTAVAVSQTGEILATYAKIHLISPGREDEAYSPGTRLGLFSLDGARLGLALCYDLRFPEIFRLYRQKGVHAVIVPAAWPQNRLRHWELFIQARAVENQMYVVGINTSGTTPVDTYAGGSMTADPHGDIIARAGSGEELLYYEIDPARADSARHDFPVESDRKDSLYATLSGADRK